nr:hypothetical protein [Mitsuaria sp. TWR114]
MISQPRPQARHGGEAEQRQPPALRLVLGGGRGDLLVGRTGGEVDVLACGGQQRRQQRAAVTGHGGHRLVAPAGGRQLDDVRRDRAITPLHLQETRDQLAFAGAGFGRGGHRVLELAQVLADRRVGVEGHLSGGLDVRRLLDDHHVPHADGAAVGGDAHVDGHRFPLIDAVHEPGEPCIRGGEASQRDGADQHHHRDQRGEGKRQLLLDGKTIHGSALETNGARKGAGGCGGRPISLAAWGEEMIFLKSPLPISPLRTSVTQYGRGGPGPRERGEEHRDRCHGPGDRGLAFSSEWLSTVSFGSAARGGLTRGS